MSCPAVLGPAGRWCSGTALGSATWVFRASDCQFPGARVFPQLYGVRASQHSSHLYSACHQKNRLSVLLSITISQTIGEPRNNIRQRRACFRRTVVPPLRFVWLWNVVAKCPLPNSSHVCTTHLFASCTTQAPSRSSRPCPPLLIRCPLQVGSRRHGVQ